ncbi:AsmA-like C-terminal region-containing protein [Termitidicoccus mucosus]|uniref:Uncharacterized protein n=1 Tax=Termitidicoccus mucosus TaxID=1184151 RepID=A0A178III3_9BACT|nr:hypothetical protein AW736_12485 [Opitutaceae bacterium TSB47]
MTAAKNKKSPFAWRVCKTCADGCCTLLTWIVCAILTLLLILQIRLATMEEIALPEEAVRELQTRLAAHGLSAAFDSARIDLRGNVLVRGIRVRAAAFDDPLLTIDALQCRINPIAAILHRVAPESIRVSGASLHLPAMLSPTGAGDAIIHDIDAAIDLQGRVLSLDHLTARVENLTFSASGGLMLPQVAGKTPGEKVRDIVSRYLEAARRIADAAGRLAILDSPHIHLSLTPSREEIADIDATFSIDGLSVTADKLPPQFQAALARVQSLAGYKPDPARPLPALAFGPVSTRLQFPLKPASPRQLDLRAHLETLDIPGDIQVRNLHLDIPLQLAARADPKQSPLGARAFLPANQPPTDAVSQVSKSAPAADPPPFWDLGSGLWDLRAERASLSIGAFFTPRLTVRDIILRASPHCRPRLDVALAARLFDEPLELALDADARAGDATLRVDARIGTPLIELAESFLGPGWAGVIRPESPIPVGAAITFAGGWKFSSARGFLTSGPAVADGVRVDSAYGEFEYEDGVLGFPRAALTQGESHARGSVVIDTRSADYRFLIAGALRPPGISGWLGDWWPEFWDDYEFPGPAPRASVDVRGNFRNAARTRVYLHVNAARPVFKGVPFDNVRGLIYVRPGFCDTIESTLTLGSGIARGAFTYDYDLARDAFRRATFSYKSDLDPAHVAPIFGRAVVDAIAPLKFSSAPSLDITGQIDGPAAPGGAHEKIDFTLRSLGDSAFLDFPLANLSFAARVRDDEIALDDVSAIVAEGNLSGRARVNTAPGKHFVSFDANLDNARLGLAIGTFEKFLALKEGKPAPTVSKFQKKVAGGRLHARVSAGGNYDDLLSFQGSGVTEITDADLAEVNLLGGLSAALRNAGVFSFTSLQFTDASSSYDIKGREIAYKNITITGPQARVTMNGSYYLDAKEMRMRAKLYPFRESRNVIGATVGFLLTPFSAALELRLDGTLEEPKWRFAYGPASLARALSGTGGAPASANGQDAEKEKAPSGANAAPPAPSGSRRHGPLR